MDSRKQQILRAIITDYINTAEPVGSRTVAKKYGLGVSSATIRNEMSDLEELGYIEQPHTSAGRVPSHKGYRYYVDFLMDHDEALTDADRTVIQQTFQEKLGHVDRLINDTCRLLSELSHYTSMMMVAVKSKGTLEQMQLLSINPFQAVLILITDVGLVHHRIVDFPVPVAEKRLKEICETLLAKLKGRSIDEVNNSLIQEISGELHRELEIVDALFEMMEEGVKGSGEEKVFLDGTLNILNQPEFHDIDRVRDILTFLREEDVLKELLSSRSREGMTFSIGSELSHGRINQCSMVTYSYQADDNTMGTIGVLGPTRMEYSRSATLLREIAGRLSKNLDGKGKKNKRRYRLGNEDEKVVNQEEMAADLENGTDAEIAAETVGQTLVECLTAENESLIAENAALAKECEEAKEGLLRIKAEFDNYRRRTLKEKEELSQVAAGNLIACLLPVLDNFERALAHGSEQGLLAGMEMVQNQMIAILGEAGLTAVGKIGEAFDPKFHDAIAQEETAEAEKDTIVEIWQQGYMMGERLLRPALVKVAK